MYPQGTYTQMNPDVYRAPSLVAQAARVWIGLQVPSKGGVGPKGRLE